MRQCFICKKGTRIGRNRSHAQNRSRRTYKANIQKVTMTVEGKKISGHFCAKCLKRLKKEIREEAAAGAEKTGGKQKTASV